MKFTFSFILLLSYYVTFGQYDVSSHILDLSEVKIEGDHEIELDAYWEFYWNRLIDPYEFDRYDPSAIVSLKDWTEFNFPSDYKLGSLGYATYRLHIKLPEERPFVSLYVPKIFSASKIWINKELAVENGIVGTVSDEVIHRRRSKIIPLKSDETKFEIVIQVANFHHSKAGIDKTLVIGTNTHLQDLNNKKIIADVIYIGCLGFIGIFFLFFYLFYWSKDISVLYFALLCISLSYNALSDRYAPLTNFFDSISWIILTKIEYIFLFLAGASASLFFNVIFSSFTHKWYSKIIIYGFGFMCLVALVLGPPYYTKTPMVFFFLMVINLIYVIFIIIKAMIGKKMESILLFVSMLQGAFIFSTHIFFYVEKNENAIIFINFGYVLVFILLSMLLMKRFSNSFMELEKSKNLAIDQKKEITIKSEELQSVNLELEKNLKLLENSNAELDDFNHIVSHDLKSPLISIYSLVSFIEDDLKEELNTDTKNHMKLLKNVVFKMENQINGLLEYSRVAKGSKRREFFSVNQLLKEVVGIVDSRNTCTVKFPKKDVNVYANRVELSHVFQNLLANSIKYNDKEKAEITITAAELSKEYVFTVLDNGPGIEPEHHDKIFKIFTRLNVDDDNKSTGIGLAIVKKIVSENNGTVSVKSKKGKGLKVSFTWRIK